jgi:hypothetical protein
MAHTGSRRAAFSLDWLANFVEVGNLACGKLSTAVPRRLKGVFRMLYVPGVGRTFAGPAVLALIALSACSGQTTVPVTSFGLPAKPGQANGALGDFLTCPYPSGDVYQKSVAGATPDADSAAYIAAVQAGGGNSGFQAWVNTQDINQATNSTPLVTVEPGNSWDVPYSPIPWSSNFFIEKDGDHHAEVVNTQACHYYEGYKTYYYASGNYLTMENNEYVDLTQPFVRPATGALSTSTGIPLGLLAVRPEELAGGVISHALGWNGVAGSMNGAAEAPCVNPAGKVRCTDGNVYQGPPSDLPMPYGSHARLKSSFDLSNFHPEAKIIAIAMQTYGLYVYDTGCCNAIILADDQYGAPEWTSQDANDLASITPADFDIVSPPLDGQKPR